MPSSERASAVGSSDSIFPSRTTMLVSRKTSECELTVMITLGCTTKLTVSMADSNRVFGPLSISLNSLNLIVFADYQM